MAQNSSSLGGLDRKRSIYFTFEKAYSSLLSSLYQTILHLTFSNFKDMHFLMYGCTVHSTYLQSNATLHFSLSVCMYVDLKSYFR